MLSDPEVMGMLMTGVSITLRLFAGALVGGFVMAMVLTGINLVPSRIVRALVALYME